MHIWHHTASDTVVSLCWAVPPVVAWGSDSMNVRVSTTALRAHSPADLCRGTVWDWSQHSRPLHVTHKDNMVE